MGQKAALGYLQRRLHPGHPAAYDERLRDDLQIYVLQGFELYRNRLIAYSLGDLVFDHYSRATGETVILRATLSPTGPPSFTLVPVYLSDSHGIPAPVTGSEARSILERMRLYSGELGLQIKVDGDRATYPAASN